MLRKEVNALLSTDLPAFLERNGLLADFEAGKLRCVCCNRKMDAGNVFAVFKRDGIKFCCNQSGCMQRFHSGGLK